MSGRVSYKEMVELYNQGFNRVEQKLDELRTEINKANEKIELVHIQATRTNGRVTVCENVCENRASMIDKQLNKIQMDNKLQDEKIWKISVKVGAIVIIIMVIIYLTTGQIVMF